MMQLGGLQPKLREEMAFCSVIFAAELNKSMLDDGQSILNDRLRDS